MNKLVAFCASLAFLIGVSGGAGAAVVPGTLDIDFRDASFDLPCNGMGGCLVDGVTVFSSGLLDWTSDDGFGVRGVGPQDDEIDPGETLTIALDTPVTLTGVWFTDMFTRAPGDVANVALSLGGGGAMVFVFSGDVVAPPADNGGQFGSFPGGFLADLIVFTTDNANTNNDFAVAGLTVVPLPGALGLMLSGLVAFVVMARRRRKSAAS